MILQHTLHPLSLSCRVQSPRSFHPPPAPFTCYDLAKVAGFTFARSIPRVELRTPSHVPCNGNRSRLSTRPSWASRRSAAERFIGAPSDRNPRPRWPRLRDQLPWNSTYKGYSEDLSPKSCESLKVYSFEVLELRSSGNITSPKNFKAFLPSSKL